VFAFSVPTKITQNGLPCKWSKPPEGFDLPATGNLNQVLSQTASGYVDLGWSVVPLWGDSKPAQAKVAAVAWTPYQRRHAGADEIERWFDRTPYAGLGIVTGTVSQLLVLDFDAPELFHAFERELPELAATRTVLTRRGRHLYFHVPPYLRVPSRKLAGVDLLSDGHYVVAPPTVIDGHVYRVKRGGLPKTVDPTDVRRINAFLDRHAVAAVQSPDTTSGLLIATHGEKREIQAFSREDESLLATASPAEPEEDSFLTAEALIRFYRGLTHQSRRNIALFKTSCLARDQGWKFEAVVAVLAGAHVDELPIGPHRCEHPKARHHEAVRTIRSAFSKPPRPPQRKDASGLFNSIREKLMQLKQTCVVRVLEGLRLAGLKAGQLVSERTVLELLKGLVGRHSVRLALGAKTPSGQPVFERISPRHPPQRFAANQIRIDRQTNAYVNETKPDSIPGRRETHFRIPSAKALCQRLGVAPSGSDPVALEDLQTAKKTRQALQRELIRRRPGTYLRKWLGDRLGVSERTVSRYNQQIVGVQVVPTFTQTPLTWGNLNAIPAPEIAPAGTCLEDSTGKRWPAIKGIAQKLLAQGREVRLLVRSLNYYWYGRGDPPVQAGLAIQRPLDVQPQPEAHVPVTTLAQQVARLVRTTRLFAQPLNAAVAKPNRELIHNGYGSTFGPPTPGVIDYAQSSSRSRRRYWQPLADPAAEALARHVYETVNGLTTDISQKVSLATARRWIGTYGAQAVALGLQTLRTRRNIQSPAAFLFTLLRSSRPHSVQ